MRRFHSSISLLLATLTLLHSLATSLVYVDFKLHQAHLAETLCPHDHQSHEFCTGDGVCQLHLRLKEAQETGADATPDLLKKISFEQLGAGVAIFCFVPSFVQVKRVCRHFLPALRTGYTSVVDSPPWDNL